MKTALVTGAAGFAAGPLIWQLIRDGWVVCATDRVEPYPELPVGVWFYICDLRDKEAMKDMFNYFGTIDVIFHVASVFDYSAPWELLESVNVWGTLNLIEEAKKHKVKKMVLWSSLAVYGEINKKNYELPVTEDQELSDNIFGLYDISKRMQEQIAIDSGFPITIIRPAPIYGADSKYGFYSLLKYIKEGVVCGLPRSITKKYMPMIFVEDLARAAIHLSDPQKYIGDIYNITDDNTLNMFDTIQFCAFLLDVEVKTLLPIPLKPFKPLLKLMGKLSAFVYKRKGMRPKLETDALMLMFGNYHFSNDKLRSTGFQFEYADRRIGIIKTIDWYKKYRWG